MTFYSMPIYLLVKQFKRSDKKSILWALRLLCSKNDAVYLSVLKISDFTEIFRAEVSVVFFSAIT